MQMFNSTKEEIQKQLIMENYKQLCVWPACVTGNTTEEIQDFESGMLEHFGVRVKYHAEVKTQPDIDTNGNPVPETGGRTDLFFYVHSDDSAKFAVPRLKAGIRWWEDVVGYNDNCHLYTEEFINAHPLNW
jgi:hypothetical protein